MSKSGFSAAAGSTAKSGRGIRGGGDRLVLEKFCSHPGRTGPEGMEAACLRGFSTVCNFSCLDEYRTITSQKRPKRGKTAASMRAGPAVKVCGSSSRKRRLEFLEYSFFIFQICLIWGCHNGVNAYCIKAPSEVGNPFRGIRTFSFLCNFVQYF